MNINSTNRKGFTPPYQDSSTDNTNSSGEHHNDSQKKKRLGGSSSVHIDSGFGSHNINDNGNHLRRSSHRDSTINNSGGSDHSDDHSPPSSSNKKDNNNSNSSNRNNQDENNNNNSGRTSRDLNDSNQNRSRHQIQDHTDNNNNNNNNNRSNSYNNMRSHDDEYNHHDNIIQQPPPLPQQHYTNPLIDFKPFKMVHNTFYKICTDLKVQFGNYIYIPEINLFKTSLSSYLSKRSNERKTFETELCQAIRDEELLLLFMQPVKSDSCLNTTKSFSESFIKLMLNIPSIQETVFNEYMGMASDFILDESKSSILIQMYSQLRWLDLIKNSDDFCNTLSEQLESLSNSPLVSLRKEIIGFLPDIIDDNGNIQIVQNILSSMNENDSSLTSVCLDTLSNLNLTSELRDKARVKIFECLKSSSSSSTFEDVPALINSLLQTSYPKESLEVIKQLRMNLQFPKISLPHIGASPIGLVHSSPHQDKKKEQQKTEELMVVTALKNNFRFKKDLCLAVIKEITNDNQAMKPLDFWLLFIIYSFWSNSKEIEQLLKRKILKGQLSVSFLKSSIGPSNDVLRDYFRPLLSIGESFLSSIEPRVRSIGNHYYILLYQTFNEKDFQEQIVISLLNHITSGINGEIDESIEVLNILSKTNNNDLLSSAYHIKSLLEHMDSLNEHQIRQIFKVFTNLAYKIDAKTGYRFTLNDMVYSDWDIFVRKYLNHPSIRYKKIGIIALCSQLEKLATIPESQRQLQLSSSSDSSNRNQLDIPIEHMDAIQHIFEQITNACKFSQASISYCYDEIVNIFNPKTFSPKFVEWIDSKITIQLSELFIKDHYHDKDIEAQWFKVDQDDIILLIYPKIIDQGVSKDKLISLSSHFRLVQTVIRAVDHGKLDRIESLLVCPLGMFDKSALDNFTTTRDKESYCLAMFFAINWLIELINAFSTQSKGDQDVILDRLSNLLELEQRFDSALQCCPSFTLPYGPFNYTDTRKKFTIDFKKLKKRKVSIDIDEDCDNYLPNLSLIKPYLRQLDLNFLGLLQRYVSNNVNSKIGSQPSSLLIDLEPISLHYLLDDLYKKLVSLTTPEKFNPLNNSLQKQQLPFNLTELIQSLHGTFPSFCIHIERILHKLPQLHSNITTIQSNIKKLKEKIEELENSNDQDEETRDSQDENDEEEEREEEEHESNDDDEDDGKKKKKKSKKLKKKKKSKKSKKSTKSNRNQEEVDRISNQIDTLNSKLADYRREESFYLANIHLMFKCLEQLFLYGDLSDNSVHKTIFIELFSNILEKKSTKSNLPQNNLNTLFKSLYDYFEGFWDSLFKHLALRPCISLLQLLIAMVKNPSLTKDLDLTQFYYSIQSYAYSVYKADWERRVNSNTVSFILDTIFTYSSNPGKILEDISSHLSHFCDGDHSKSSKSNNNNILPIYNTYSALVIFKSLLSNIVGIISKESESIQHCVKYFSFLILVGSTQFKNKSYMIESLRHSKNFFTIFIKMILPKLKVHLKHPPNWLKSLSDALNKLIENLQKICNQGKCDKDTSVTKLIPPVLKLISQLIGELKVVFIEIGCLGALEMKNVKKADLAKYGKSKNDSSSSDESNSENEDSDSEGESISQSGDESSNGNGDDEEENSDDKEFIDDDENISESENDESDHSRREDNEDDDGDDDNDDKQDNYSSDSEEEILNVTRKPNKHVIRDSDDEEPKQSKSLSKKSSPKIIDEDDYLGDIEFDN